MKQRILFLGAGNIAQAIKILFNHAKSKAEVEMWDIDETRVPNRKPLEVLVPWADLVFVCVNSWVLRDALQPVASRLKQDAGVITVAKGIEKSTGLWMHEVLEESLSGKQAYGLLSGPMLAHEISSGLGAAAVLACEKRELYDAVFPLLKSRHFQIEYSSDVAGVAACGVMKNIYAIIVGVSEGLKLGSNIRGWLAMQSIKEMTGLVQKFGGRAETVMGPAGFGDFIATGFSPHSRNHTLGREIAETGKYSVESEGYASLPQFLKKIDFNTSAYPVLHALRLILMENRDSTSAFQQMLDMP